jgi:hypothetical protein
MNQQVKIHIGNGPHDAFLLGYAVNVLQELRLSLFLICTLPGPRHFEI